MATDRLSEVLTVMVSSDRVHHVKEGRVVLEGFGAQPRETLRAENLKSSVCRD